jgi:hypothetical protein
VKTTGNDPVYYIIHEFSRTDYHGILIRAVGVPVDIRTRYLPNTNQRRYRFGQLNLTYFAKHISTCTTSKNILTTWQPRRQKPHPVDI